MGGMSDTGAPLIIGKGDIHAPVPRVLDAPVRADGSHQAPGIGQAADVKTLLGRDLAFDAPFRLDNREAFQVWPLLGLGQPGKLIEGIATTGFQTAMILLHEGFPLPYTAEYALYYQFEPDHNHAALANGYLNLAAYSKICSLAPLPINLLA